ncbi:MAG TPA: Mov34/MPN/PAD-1 family protein [Ktedonobacteraceae bacterium]|nr:Mov34/MPN/PAD-1 family protein [Ktedonobacteraceae bacterium]
MQKTDDATLTLSDHALNALLDDVAQRTAIEACGVLLGHTDAQGNWFAEQAYPLRNIADSSVYFEFDPEELLTVELTHELPPIGVYHSHPTGYPMASDTDRRNMQRVNLEQRIPWVWVIVCGPFTPTRQEAPRMIAYHHYTHGLQEITIEQAASS